ncbi:MAG TPA: hypothetical protein VIL00_01285 [Pseudonocardiaceae bacterium]
MAGVLTGRLLQPRTAAERRLLANPMALPDRPALDRAPVEFDPYDPEPDPRQAVRAQFLTRVIMMLLTEEGHERFWREHLRPPMIRLERAYVTGELVLRAADLPHLIEFDRCRFEQAPDLRQARLNGIGFTRCWLPGLRANNLFSGNDVVLERCAVHAPRMTAEEDRFAVDLTDAEIKGSLRLDRTEIRHPRGLALRADRINTTGGLLATGLEVHGEFRMPSATVGGFVKLDAAWLVNPGGRALDANCLHVRGHLRCTRPLTGPLRSQAFSAVGQLHLPCARVDGDLSLSGARLTTRTTGARPSGEDGSAQSTAVLVADRIQVGGRVELDNGFHATGPVLMSNARIDGTLRLAGAELESSIGEPVDPMEEIAIRLSGTEVASDLVAEDMRTTGRIELVGTRVRGSVDLTRARLYNPDGFALVGHRLGVASDLILRELRAAGSVLVRRADIGSNLDLRGAVLERPDRTAPVDRPEPSLDIMSTRIGRDVRATERFCAEGGVRMQHVEVDRAVDLNEAVLGKDRGGVSLNAFGLVCKELGLALGAVPTGRVRLNYARCRTLWDNEHLWRSAGGVELDDFSYRCLHPRSETEPRVRLRWLRQVLPDYAPGPYDQLAATYRAAGQVQAVREVLMVKERHYHRSLLRASPWWLRPLVWLWDWMQRSMFGYGYRPARAVVWLAMTALLGSLWFAAHPLQPVNPTDRMVWHPVLYTLDHLFPVIDMGHDKRWRADGASLWISTALLITGWVLASAVAAGLTRVMRRTP